MGSTPTTYRLHTYIQIHPSAYEALQLFSSQAKRKAKDGEPQAGIGVALEGG